MGVVSTTPESVSPLTIAVPQGQGSSVADAERIEAGTQMVLDALGGDHESLAVPDLPRTRSGKLVEMAVRNVVEGRPVTNLEALANPEALEAFRSRPELA